MIALAGCSTRQRIVVVGSKSMELMLELHRRGYSLAAAAGVAVAVGLARELTPKGTIDHSVLHSTLVVSAGAVAVAIAAIALGGAAARGPAIERRRTRSSLSRVPWELPVLIAAAISYVFVERGGGLVEDPTIGAHPRLIVLLFPLLLAAGIAGVASRAGRWAVRRRAIPCRADPPASAYCVTAAWRHLARGLSAVGVNPKPGWAKPLGGT